MPWPTAMPAILTGPFRAHGSEGRPLGPTRAGHRQGQWPAATGALLPAAEPPERKSGYRMVQPPSAAFFSAVVLLRVDYSSLRMSFDGIDNAAETGGSRPSRRQFEPSRAPARSAAPAGHSREPDFRTRPHSQDRGRAAGRTARARNASSAGSSSPTSPRYAALRRSSSSVTSATAAAALCTENGSWYTAAAATGCAPRAASMAVRVSLAFW